MVLGAAAVGIAVWQLGCLEGRPPQITWCNVTGVWAVMAGVVFWGLHMGLTQGFLAAMVADTTPPELRGTAFGVFNLVSGIAMLFASLFAGLLWDQYRPAATFFGGAGFTVVALIGLVIAGRSHPGTP